MAVSLAKPETPAPDLTEQAPAEGEPTTRRRMLRAATGHRSRIGAGARLARNRMLHWASVRALTDTELTAELVDKRDKQQARLLHQRQADVVSLDQRLAQAQADAALAATHPGMTTDPGAVRRLRGELAAARILAAQVEDAPPLPPPTTGELTRARLGKRMLRWAIIAASAYGALAVLVPRPGAALLAGAALLGTLWRLGRPDSGQPEQEAAVSEPAPLPADAPVSFQKVPVQLAPKVEIITVAEPTPPPADQAAWVTDALTSCGVTGSKVLTVSNCSWGVLVDLEMPRGAKMLNEKLGEVEAALRLRIGGLSFQVKPEDAGIITLRVVRSDPFAGLGAPYHHEPMSLSVRRPLNVGLEMDGSAFAITLARVHAALVGGSGSGKSSALWTIIDALSACEDVVLMGIDLTGAPALTAWGDVIQELATEPEHAEDLLQRLVKMGRGRCTDLGERSRPRLGQPLPDITSENWEPSPEGPQIVLIVDEYPTLVEAGLWPYVATLLKIARKGALTVLLASQRATQAELGSTTVKAQLGLMGLLACDPQDVQQLLGPGMRAKGWTPDRLQPALGDQPNDAGVVYAYGGQHVTPTPKKFYRLSLAQVHGRALERMGAGLPRIDAATAAYAEDAAPVEVDLDALATDQDGQGAELTEQQVTLLQTVVSAFGDSTRAHVRTLAAWLDDHGPEQYRGWTATELGAALREADVPIAAKLKVDKQVTTGVFLDAVVRRLNAAPRPTTRPATD